MNIFDIARLAGTSKSTVSRVLTNNPNVNPKTRQRVLDVIHATDYCPNSIARGLVSGSLRAVAIIISDIRNPFNAELTWYIEQELYKNNYQMFLCCSDNNEEKENAIFDSIRQYSFAGLILLSAVGSDNLKEKFESLQGRIVLVNRYVDNLAADFLTSDNFQGGYLAARHLIELGHTRIAILSGGHHLSTHHDRREGFLGALSTYHIDLPQLYDMVGQCDFESGYAAGQALLDMDSNAPSAIFATTDTMALGIIKAYQDHGKTIPDDLSIVGFDDISFTRMSGFSLTTVRQPFDEMGTQTVQMLLKRIQNNPPEQQKIILDCHLVIRDSTAPFSSK